MKTKYFITVILKEILKEKALKDIKVQNIIEAADISRSTFYRHFDNKYCIAQWYYDVHIEDFIKNQPLKEVGKYIFKFVFKERDFFSKVADYEYYDSFGNHHQRSCYQFYTLQFKTFKKSELTHKEELAIALYAYGSSRTMMEYIKNPNFVKEDEQVFYDVIYDEQPDFLKMYK